MTDRPAVPGIDLFHFNVKDRLAGTDRFNNGSSPT
jgi:hypothetical protein